MRLKALQVIFVVSFTSTFLVLICKHAQAILHQRQSIGGGRGISGGKYTYIFCCMCGRLVVVLCHSN